MCSNNFWWEIMGQKSKSSSKVTVVSNVEIRTVGSKQLAFQNGTPIGEVETRRAFDDMGGARSACRRPGQFVVGCQGKWYRANELDRGTAARFREAAKEQGPSEIISGVTIEDGCVFRGEQAIGVKVGEFQNLQDAMGKAIGDTFVATTRASNGCRAMIVLVRKFRVGEQQPMCRAKRERIEAERKAAEKMEELKERALEILVSDQTVVEMARKLGNLVCGLEGEERRTLVDHIKDLMGKSFSFDDRNRLLIAIGEPTELPSPQSTWSSGSTWTQPPRRWGDSW
jgi:hypothetical protein